MCASETAEDLERAQEAALAQPIANTGCKGQSKMQQTPCYKRKGKVVLSFNGKDATLSYRLEETLKAAQLCRREQSSRAL
eukprot:1094806-Amphidinium_carterae.1